MMLIKLVAQTVTGSLGNAPSVGALHAVTTPRTGDA